MGGLPRRAPAAPLAGLHQVPPHARRGLEAAGFTWEELRELSSPDAVDLWNRTQSLESFFAGRIHPSLGVAWRSDVALRDELQDIEKSDATLAGRITAYIAACQAMRCKRLLLCGGGSYKPLQAKLGSVTGQGCQVLLDPPRMVARSAIRWVGPLLGMLPVQTQADWLEGQSLLQWHHEGQHGGKACLPTDEEREPARTGHGNAARTGTTRAAKLTEAQQRARAAWRAHLRPKIWSLKCKRHLD